MHAIFTVIKMKLKLKTLRSTDSNFVIYYDKIIAHKEILVTKKKIYKSVKFKDT